MIAVALSIFEGIELLSEILVHFVRISWIEIVALAIIQ